ncbi:MAG: hypothetical protein ACOC1X_02960 [Promethearchaeota archaeon]
MGVYEPQQRIIDSLSLEINDAETNILAAINALSNQQSATEFKANNYANLRENPAKFIYNMPNILQIDSAWNISLQSNIPNANTSTSESATGTIKIGTWKALNYFYFYVNGAWSGNPSLKIARLRRMDDDVIITEKVGNDVANHNSNNFALVKMSTQSAYGENFYLEIFDNDSNSSSAWIGVNLIAFFCSEI